MWPAGPTLPGLSSPASSEVNMYFVSSEVRGLLSLGYGITSVLPHLHSLERLHSREECTQIQPCTCTTLWGDTRPAACVEGPSVCQSVCLDIFVARQVSRVPRRIQFAVVGPWVDRHCCWVFATGSLTGVSWPPFQVSSNRNGPLTP